MDKLIERELLAQEAEKLGFDVSTKEVEDMIAEGRMMVMGVPRRVDDYVFKDGKFDYERFKMVSQNQLGVSVMRFIEIEQRELLADRMRELMRMSSKVSPDEVKSDFESEGAAGEPGVRPLLAAPLRGRRRGHARRDRRLREGARRRAEEGLRGARLPL